VSASEKSPKKRATKSKLTVVQPRSQVDCLSCALCCTYIAVGIDAPKTPKSATEILWHLYHEGVSIYCDGDDADAEWMVQLESRCRHLGDDNKCAIYENRPHICRDYSEQSCEVNATGVGTTFYAPDEFLAYLQKKKKRIFAAISVEHVPPADKLGRVPRSRRKHEPFEARFSALRAMGEGPAIEASPRHKKRKG